MSTPAVLLNAPGPQGPPGPRGQTGAAGAAVSVTGSGVVHATTGVVDSVANIGAANSVLTTNAGGTDIQWQTGAAVAAVLPLSGDVNGNANANYVSSLSGTGGIISIPAAVPQIQVKALASNTATSDFKIQGQYAFTSASGGNRKAGNVIIDVGLPTNGLTAVEAYLGVTRNGALVYACGANPGSPATQSALWLLSNGNALAPGNAALYSDGGSFTYLNGQVTLGVLINDTTFVLYFPPGASQMILGSTLTTTAPEYFDMSGTATLHFGGGATKAAQVLYDGQTSDTATLILNFRGQDAMSTASTNVTGGDVAMRGGAGVTNNYDGKVKLGSNGAIIQTIGGTINGRLHVTGNVTIDNNASTWSRFYITASSTMTLMAPTIGREWGLTIDATAGPITVNFAQHASEKINGVAATLSYPTVAQGDILHLVLSCEDGTNWWVT